MALVGGVVVWSFDIVGALSACPDPGLPGSIPGTAYVHHRTEGCPRLSSRQACRRYYAEAVHQWGRQSLKSEGLTSI